MKELQKEFTGTGDERGNTFRQIKETEHGFIYEVWHEEGIMHYEVFKRRIQKECDVQFPGTTVHYEEQVKYPTTNDFGVWAWCFRGADFKKAMDKLNAISCNMAT